jgi:hypothetical protein
MDIESRYGFSEYERVPHNIKFKNNKEGFILKHDLKQKTGVLLAGLVLSIGLAGPTQAAPIGFGAFGGGAVMESFEGLSAGLNIPLLSLGSGYLGPGSVSSYTFGSGATLTGPIPNPEFGVVIGDFTIGTPAAFSLQGNGDVSSAAVVPFGSAYMGLDAESGVLLVEFTLPTDVLRVGAFVTGIPGMVTIEVLNASDVVLETYSIASVVVGSWGINFLGIETAGIRKVRFSGEGIVLDKLTFETGAASAPIPEPSTMLLLGSGLVGLVAWRKRKSQA